MVMGSTMRKNLQTNVEPCIQRTTNFF
eukprot:SAG31_NODE_42101_length_273_cov_0.591954_1_plen_26_part_10